MSVTASVSRSELYDQVWTTPMRVLAKQYGLSDVGLAKICKRHEVPRPPVGYWAKKEVGKAPPRPPLPQITDEELQEVTITPLPPPSSKGVDPTGEYDADIIAILQKAEAMPRIQVTSSLRSPHQLVRLTERCLNDASPDPQSLVSPPRSKSQIALAVRVAKPTVKRAMRFYDALIKAVERLDGKVAVEGCDWQKETVIYIAGEKAATIRIRERYKQKEREPKDRTRGYYWRTYEYKPTGNLVVELGGIYPRSGNFEDSAKSVIEDRIGELLRFLIQSAHENRKRRREEEEKCRREEERERDRQEKLRLIKAEEGRLQKLLAEVRDWHRSVRIRNYVTAVKAQADGEGGIEEGSKLDNWLMWASQQADRFDPLVVSPPSIIDEKSKYERRYGW